MRYLPERILCLVTDIDRAGGVDNMLDITREAVRGGVNMVQVRAHHLQQATYSSFLGRVVEIASESAVVMANAPAELVQGSEADGVHYRDGMAIDALLAGQGLIAGQSVHSLESAISAERAGIDYIVLGTVYRSASHPGGPAGGESLVLEVAESVGIPVIGIGGIAVRNADAVMAAGASGVAVIGAIIEQADHFRAARELARAVGL